MIDSFVILDHFGTTFCLWQFKEIEVRRLRLELQISKSQSSIQREKLEDTVPLKFNPPLVERGEGKKFNGGQLRFIDDVESPVVTSNLKKQTISGRKSKSRIEYVESSEGSESSEDNTITKSHKPKGVKSSVHKRSQSSNKRSSPTEVAIPTKSTVPVVSDSLAEAKLATQKKIDDLSRRLRHDLTLGFSAVGTMVDTETEAEKEADRIAGKQARENAASLTMLSLTNDFALQSLQDSVIVSPSTVIASSDAVSRKNMFDKEKREARRRGELLLREDDSEDIDDQDHIDAHFSPSLLLKPSKSSVVAAIDPEFNGRKSEIGRKLVRA